MVSPLCCLKSLVKNWLNGSTNLCTQEKVSVKCASVRLAFHIYHNIYTPFTTRPHCFDSTYSGPKKPILATADKRSSSCDNEKFSSTISKALNMICLEGSSEMPICGNVQKIVTFRNSHRLVTFLNRRRRNSYFRCHGGKPHEIQKPVMFQ